MWAPFPLVLRGRAGDGVMVLNWKGQRWSWFTLKGRAGTGLVYLKGNGRGCNFNPSPCPLPLRLREGWRFGKL